MRKLVALIVLTVCLFPLVSQQQSVSVTCDMVALKGIFEETLCIRTECSFGLSDEFGFSIPVSCIIEKEIGSTLFLQSGLFLKYRPFCNPLFLSVSLLQVGMFVIDVYQKEDSKLHFLNELTFGWTYKHKSGLVIEPQLILSDPNGISADAYEELGDRFSHFPMTRVSVLLGWSFSIQGLEKKGGL
ncbi:MAG: hypothetical protein EOM15_10945 [Spirochaetia bacterium]|nr:hypothetical protein [Spirochaetia bacterium]